MPSASTGPAELVRELVTALTVLYEERHAKDKEEQPPRRNGACLIEDDTSNDRKTHPEHLEYRKHGHGIAHHERGVEEVRLQRYCAQHQCDEHIGHGVDQGKLVVARKRLQQQLRHTGREKN